MTIHAGNFYTQVVVPALEVLENDARIPLTAFDICLNMATCAQESLMGTFLVQTGGSALGPYQIEPASLTDVIARLTAPQKAALATLATPAQPQFQVITNLVYACAICRLYYLQRNTIAPPAPENITIASLWGPYKQFYNTNAGAATEAQFVQNFNLTQIILPSKSSAAPMIMVNGSGTPIKGVPAS